MIKVAFEIYNDSLNNNPEARKTLSHIFRELADHMDILYEAGQAFPLNADEEVHLLHDNNGERVGRLIFYVPVIPSSKF